MSFLEFVLDLKYSVKQLSCLLMCVYVRISFHAGRDFNDTVIVTEVPEAQTLLVHAIQIFDDEINEGREVFDVFLEVVGNISNTVVYRIQTTQCRIRQSDRKLSCNICMLLMYNCVKTCNRQCSSVSTKCSVLMNIRQVPQHLLS